MVGKGSGPIASTRRKTLLGHFGGFECATIFQDIRSLVEVHVVSFAGMAAATTYQTSSANDFLCVAMSTGYVFGPGKRVVGP